MSEYEEFDDMEDDFEDDDCEFCGSACHSSCECPYGGGVF